MTMAGAVGFTAATAGGGETGDHRRTAAPDNEATLA